MEKFSDEWTYDLNFAEDGRPVDWTGDRPYNLTVDMLVETKNFFYCFFANGNYFSGVMIACKKTAAIKYRNFTDENGERIEGIPFNILTDCMYVVKNDGVMLYSLYNSNAISVYQTVEINSNAQLAFEETELKNIHSKYGRDTNHSIFLRNGVFYYYRAEWSTTRHSPTQTKLRCELHTFIVDANGIPQNEQSDKVEWVDYSLDVEALVFDWLREKGYVFGSGARGLYAKAANNSFPMYGFIRGEPDCHAILNVDQNSTKMYIGPAGKELSFDSTKHITGYTRLLERPESLDYQNVKGKFGVAFKTMKNDVNRITKHFAYQYREFEDKTTVLTVDYKGKIKTAELPETAGYVKDIAAIDNADNVYIVTNYDDYRENYLRKIEDGEIKWTARFYGTVGAAGAKLLEIRFTDDQEYLYVLSSPKYGFSKPTLACIRASDGRAMWGINIYNPNIEPLSYRDHRWRMSHVYLMLDLPNEETGELKPNGLFHHNTLIDGETQYEEHELSELKFGETTVQKQCMRMPAHPKYIARFKEGNE